MEGKVRIRPFSIAPFSTDDKDATTSPLPEVIDKVLKGLPDGGEFTETAKIFALLDVNEKWQIKETYKTFPRFLRLHGREVCVSTDNMKVKKFIAENEKCVDNLSSDRLKADAINPSDPILQIQAVMDETTNADWAIKELYDCLPLMQCVEIRDLLVLVSQSIRDGLPKDLPEALQKYPDYFAVWEYPDEPGLHIVQRAKLVTPEMTDDDVARMIMPLVPQGGIDKDKLMRKVPLQLQRYMYRRGLKVVLARMPKYFLVVGDKVMRVS